MTSLVHIFECWDHFSRGKRKRKDIQYFERNLEDNIFQLQNDLITFQYQHDAYEHFYVSDPKQRHISKASVKDRLVHQIVYEVLTTVFDRKFIFHSLSSRVGKGNPYWSQNAASHDQKSQCKWKTALLCTENGY